MAKLVCRSGIWSIVALTTFLLSGCGILFGGGDEAPTPTAAVVRTLAPTFTPTPANVAVSTPAPPPATPTQIIELAVNAAAPAEATAAPAVEATPTPAPAPKLTIDQDAVNVRLGPGTNYGLAGVVSRGQEFTIVGRDQNEDWWLICCVNGKEVWVNDELTSERDEGSVAVVTDIPDAPQPVAEAPASVPAAQPAPAEPTATPEPAPPPAADPCAGIGGDGCKFKLRAGPSFAPNGGVELKLQIHFIHSGVDGGQPQGSYFVWMEKDGVKLPISDSIRSIALVDQQGTLGKYNYEVKIAPSSIPGNTVAGNYALWVLDGNGERDSQTFTFTVPDGQGEVWMQFDQG
ncbi:MAG TPA: SH3 domain-containing protein [Chloroflexi bacterium]|nr:SH3 domain-containing protein [Chloroflexota bacterium]